MRQKSIYVKIGFGCVLAALFASGAQARFKVLHSFAGGFDGSHPQADLFIDSSGVLYGTTTAGGIGGNMGTVFKIVPGGKEKVLHAFSGGAADGAQPSGGVIADKQGNLYGLTAGGGANGLGVVYKLAPDGGETLVHT
ncbi:MAG TPA: choice-of-anchor tandem repeat GloVer-containing protein, partial [Rhizomicrobium sp.]